MIELQEGDLFECPSCRCKYPDPVEEIKVIEGLGVDNLTKENCEECDCLLSITEYERGMYSIEILEDEEEDLDEFEEHYD